jgi:hypothetical protein
MKRSGYAPEVYKLKAEFVSIPEIAIEGCLKRLNWDYEKARAQLTQDYAQPYNG